MKSPPNRKRAFFGRRKGHALKPRQAALFGTLLPRLALDLDKTAPSDLATLFPHAVEAGRLEIGIAGGQHMIAEAQRNQRSGVVGVEPLLNGVAKDLASVADNNLANIRLHFGDAI